MTLAQVDDNGLLKQRRLAVPVWLKFAGCLVLSFYGVVFLFATIYLLGGDASTSFTFSDYTLQHPFRVLAMLWGGFALMAICFYGLLRGHYAGLISCLALSYLGLADAVYRFATTGTLDLTLLIYLIVLTQLHKIWRRWRKQITHSDRLCST
ncbi:hypothetical protein [Alkalimonas amylolytica]|uniref:Uncharacterized protein n=1 Tax=Alkalimonas amylolytica TaxID=152573 RepID=A0A1H4DFK2_ALKAM|nr:hypothetical protein [Alkalimonas amylolytica]SEA71367.1 hypothetical protein SAMN04488051_105221 [Alkalimonas amylolytica]